MGRCKGGREVGKGGEGVKSCEERDGWISGEGGAGG